MTESTTTPLTSHAMASIGPAWPSSTHCANEQPASSTATTSDQLDRLVRATVAAATGGVSPATLWLAGLDWAAHLVVSPGKQYGLILQGLRYVQDALTAAPSVHDAQADPRFRDADWQRWPFRWLRDTFLGL
ncbi:poly-beta-hydroxybutyrate polymerase N-terminal domain-containing protein [Cupriavidus necator]|uniref:poly-beta-hydroxybutyrate polymerase N-terminal domain-containing protein n=1 Tax=Cupriavidus necator TaxID=106590 RepID=UPI00339D9E5E